MKLIQQYYQEDKYINVNSNNYANQTVYKPSKVRNAEFDLSITESTSTPAYRMVMNDFLMQMFSAGQVTIEEMLENGVFPFADKLLQSIRARKQQMQAGQTDVASVVPAEIQQQILPQLNNIKQSA